MGATYNTEGAQGEFFNKQVNTPIFNYVSNSVNSSRAWKKQMFS